jgi:Flp pilus assembly protein TadD
MSWLSRLLGGSSDSSPKPQRLDYLSEALVLERQGDYDAAVTSYRLALREHPDDLKVLQNLAIALSKIGRVEEAIRAYRKALEIDSSLSGAHYGLAFLLIKRGDSHFAIKHLKAFLAHAPSGPDAERWVAHAQATLDQLVANDSSSPSAGL